MAKEGAVSHAATIHTLGNPHGGAQNVSYPVRPFNRQLLDVS